MVGLTMAGTPMGPPAVNAIDTVANTIVTGFAAFGSGGGDSGHSDGTVEDDHPSVVTRDGHQGGGHR